MASDDVLGSGFAEGDLSDLDDNDAVEEFEQSFQRRQDEVEAEAIPPAQEESPAIVAFMQRLEALQTSRGPCEACECPVEDR